MDLKTVRVQIPDGANIILGQTHFIKTTEDLYEILVGASPHIKFGVAFTEASGPCLIRYEGNDSGLTQAAIKTVQDIAAGHVFAIFVREAFPINVLNSVKMCPEVCSIYCATANPLEVIVAETDQGRGIMGVVDGNSPKGIEQDTDKAARKTLLRNFGYKVK
jgi:adenosine/AMP kinase